MEMKAYVIAMLCLGAMILAAMEPESRFKSVHDFELFGIEIRF